MKDVVTLATPATATSLAGGLGSALPDKGRAKDNLWVNGPSMNEGQAKLDGSRLAVPEAQKKKTARGNRAVVVLDEGISDHSHSFSNCEEEVCEDPAKIKAKHMVDISDDGSGDENVKGDEEEDSPYSKKASYKMSQNSEGEQMLSNSKKDRGLNSGLR